MEESCGTFNINNIKFKLVFFDTREKTSWNIKIWPSEKNIKYDIIYKSSKIELQMQKLSEKNIN